MQWDELHWKTPGDKIPYQTDNPWFYRPYDIPDVGRTIWIMGWNYERGEGEMLESYCHRIESVLSLTVGRGVWDPKRNRDNVWNRFTRVDKDFPGESEVGSVHYAPNSTSDYDWSNTNAVWTYADDWLTYPNLPRKKKLLNADQRRLGRHRRPSPLVDEAPAAQPRRDRWLLQQLVAIHRQLRRGDEASRRRARPSRRRRPRCTRSEGPARRASDQ